MPEKKDGTSKYTNKQERKADHIAKVTKKAASPKKRLKNGLGRP